MTIRFNCTACRTVLKIGEMISESRKVRCTGCGIVIVVSPDEDSPNGVSATIPQQSSKEKSRSRQELAPQRNILIGILIAVVLVMGIGLWWTFSPPSDRGAVDGKVTLDGQLLEKGEIVFHPIEGTKGPMTMIPIVNGRYEVGYAKGPGIGRHKIEIHCWEKTGKMKLGPKGEQVDDEKDVVAAKFNVKSDLTFEVGRGAQSKDWAVTR